MSYEMTEPSVPNDSPPAYTFPTHQQSHWSKLLLLLLLLVSVGLGTQTAAEESTTLPHLRSTQAISRACSPTRYPTLCVNSLLGFPGAHSASPPQLAHISINLTLQRFGKALQATSEMSNLPMGPLLRSKYQDCLELMDASVDLLARSLSAGSLEDVRTWLSAAMTNRDTCAEGLDGAAGSGAVRDQMSREVQGLSELVSNSLAMLAAGGGGGVPAHNRRLLMASPNGKATRRSRDLSHYPKWLTRKERTLLEKPVSEIAADIVVSKEGSGTVKTISEAIKMAPSNSRRRIVIYIKAGVYEESNLKVERGKTNLMFVGDGKASTVISGRQSAANNPNTFDTASFAAAGAGFIARDMTFRNDAGPNSGQAVALLLRGDHAVGYRCGIIGYQDTLYVHSQRQFFRECDIYGTVDFIFGNAAVVFQDCNIYARKPMPKQRNTITAQKREDPNQNTGMSFHACQILAAADLEASKGTFPTYLGRPWGPYARTVYMLSFMGDHINPRGWLDWEGSAPTTLYYGEYMNSGPGAATGQRVKWPGYRVITSSVEASKFTVSQFIYGSSWLPSTGVAFRAGLNV